MIKHLCNLDDRETVEQICENMYLQYFLGYSSFTPECPFDTSLFVEFRKRLGMESVNAINERIIALKTNLESSKDKGGTEEKDGGSKDKADHTDQDKKGKVGSKGRVRLQIPACDQHAV